MLWGLRSPRCKREPFLLVTAISHPRSGRFKEEIIQAFYDGFHHKPGTTFGTVNADVLADKDPSFRPINFCRVIRTSAWPA